MKKIFCSILFFAAFFGFSPSTDAQKVVTSEAYFKYTMYPKVKFAKETVNYMIDFQTSDSYLLQTADIKKDSQTKKQIYSVSENKNDLRMTEIKGLNKTTTSDKALKIEISLTAVGKPAAVIAEAKRQLKSGKLVSNVRNLVSIKVKVFEKGKVLKEYTYAIESSVKEDYITKVKTDKPTDDYDFKSPEAEVLFLLSDAFETVEKNICKDLSTDFETFKLTEELIFSSGKGDFDYALQDKALADARLAMQGDLKQFDEALKIWDETCKKITYESKDQYNTKVVAGMFLNIMNTYLVLGKYDKVAETYTKLTNAMPEIPMKYIDNIQKIKTLSEQLKENSLTNAHRF